MSGGTFNVDRSIWDHPEFAPSEFSEREAFLWLISEAAWKPRRVRVGRVVVDLERGQLCASVRFIAEAWMWSKSRVDRFLKRLKNRDMIGTDSGTGQLVITICNYSKFQGCRDTSGTRAGRNPGHERDTSGTNEKKDVIREEEEREDPSDPPAQLALRVVVRFEDFWSEWPMAKTGRKRAEASFNRLSPENRAAAKDNARPWAERWRRMHPTASDIHPATYLNGRRWEDQETGKSDEQLPSDEERRAAEFDRWFAECRAAGRG